MMSHRRAPLRLRHECERLALVTRQLKELEGSLQKKLPDRVKQGMQHLQAASRPPYA